MKMPRSFTKAILVVSAGGALAQFVAIGLAAVKAAAMPSGALHGGGDDDQRAPLDSRLIFLERAAARLILVNAGEMDLGEAITGLTTHFEEIVGLCSHADNIVAKWERNYPPVSRRKRVAA
jgi:hypothetical protein